MDLLLEGLNEAQQAAVQHIEGPLLVLAGPGSGKTRVVTHRIAWILRQGVPSWQVAALTFTNKAAEEMTARVAELVPNHRVWLGTFHRFCSWHLRIYANKIGLNPNFTIYDQDQCKQLLMGLVDRKGLPPGIDCMRIASAISWAKNAMIMPEDFSATKGNLLGEIVEQVYPQYQEELLRANAVDFDDLLVHFARLLKESPETRQELDARYQYILVDEYQDTNLVQYAIARALSQDYPNLCVTGDPDQSIYGWRGANIRNILEFEHDFKDVRTIRLEENYRSTKAILAVADSLIQHNVHRKKKELYTNNAEGNRPRVMQCYDQYEEADQIVREIVTEIRSEKRRPCDYAIFYRMNALSRNLEHAFHRYGVPFQLVRGLEFFRRKEIKDVLAYLQLIANEDDKVSFLRVINTPARGIGKATLDRVALFASQYHLTLWNASRLIVEASLKSVKKRAKKVSFEIESDPDSTLSTSHAGLTPPALPKRAASALAGFVKILDNLRKISESALLEELVSAVLHETGYLASLQKDSSEEDIQRLANVQELLSEVHEFDEVWREESASDEKNEEFFPGFSAQSRLEGFLERAALVSDVDGMETDADRVSLMTLHAAKGLEFPVVYIIAMEENILPHERCVHDEKQLEEERRLFFVGVTRAREELRISRTQFRDYRGQRLSSILSRFFFDIKPELLEFVSPDPSEKSIEPLSETGLEERGDRHNSGQGELIIVAPPEKQRELVSEDEDAAPLLGQKPGRKCLKKKESSDRFEGIDEEPIYEEEMTVVYDDEGRTHRESPNRKREKKGMHALEGKIMLGSALLKKNEEKSESAPAEIKVGTMVRHRDYGLGVVRELMGPKEDRLASIEFFSAIGQLDVPLSDGLFVVGSAANNSSKTGIAET